MHDHADGHGHGDNSTGPGRSGIARNALMKHWPKLDIWTVLVVLVIAVLALLLTFEIWIPHGLGHQD